MMTIVSATKNPKMILMFVNVNGQIGHLVDHVPKAVVEDFNYILGISLDMKVMLDHVLDQVKNIVLVIPKAALVSFQFFTLL